LQDLLACGAQVAEHGPHTGHWYPPYFHSWDLYDYCGANTYYGSKHYVFLSAAIFALFLLLCSGKCRGERNLATPTAEITDVLNAYRGEKQIAKITSVIAKGQIVDFENGTAGSYARYFERSGKLRIEVMPEKGDEVRILNGSDGWQTGQKKDMEVSGTSVPSFLIGMCTSL
jgi:hypothetical protein